MTVTNRQSGTNVHEISDGIYRINTPVAFEGGGGFTFNQYLIADDEPLLFHTGPRKMFALVREAAAIGSAGSTRRTSRTPGNAASWPRNRRARCCAAICSPRAERTGRRSPRRTSWARAQPSAGRWIISRTRHRPET